MRHLLILIFAANVVLAQNAFAQILDRQKIWFGVEYTFQDQTMVDEPGRSTISTPHKEQKAAEVTENLRRELGLPVSAIERKTTWKPGLYLNVPGDGKWVINSEPVTIEINTLPRTIDQIRETAKPIFRATKAAGLVAHVNPAAERSGMGHIHVGAARVGDNPFFKHPLLLRNVMLYIHQNPALLHGFAEAFDIGMNSNIETYHSEERQKLLKSVIDKFDSWYDKASPEKRLDGLSTFRRFLTEAESFSFFRGKKAGFFEHYRFINLEHLNGKELYADKTGKITVEFRNFRPPKSPETAEAFATLLLAIMEKQAKPEHKEPFRWVSEGEYLRFNTGTKVLENWEKVRSELGLQKNKILNAEVAEYAEAVQRFRYLLPDIKAEVFLAYSQKTNKGKFFELRLPANEGEPKPEISYGRHLIDLELVQVGSKSYWVGILNTEALGIDPRDLMDGRVKLRRFSAPYCLDVFRPAA